MDFSHEGDTLRTGGSSGGFASGLMAGSCLNRRDEDSGKYMMFAAIIILIVFFIAIIFLALAFRERREPVDYGRKDNSIGEILAATIAAKGIGCNDGYAKYADHDHLEIKSQMQHFEDRREIAGVRAELGAFGLLAQKTAADNDKSNQIQFGEIKAALGMQSQALAQVLQVQNNAAIIQGVVNQLMLGKPCLA